MQRLDAESDDEKEAQEASGPKADFVELMTRELTAGAAKAAIGRLGHQMYRAGKKALFHYKIPG